MVKVRSLVGVAAALIATPLLGLPAWGAACVTGSVASYEALGSTGCTVDGKLFFNIDVEVTTGGGGTVDLGNFIPFTSADGLEHGLSLTYNAIAPVAGARADVAWTYNVVAIDGQLINDAFLALSGQTTGAGVVQVNETLSNGVVLSLTGAGSTTAFFTPIAGLSVFKDQVDFVGPAGGSATSSILTNAFSQVPGPIAGAGLPGLMAACAGLLGLARRRRRQVA